MGYAVIDAFRWFVIAEGAFLFGFAAAVLQSARRFNAPPRAVIFAVISYLMLVIAVIWEVHHRIGDPPTWRSFMAALSFTSGIVSTWMMWRTYSYAARIARHRGISQLSASRMIEDKRIEDRTS